MYTALMTDYTIQKCMNWVMRISDTNRFVSVICQNCQCWRRVDKFEKCSVLFHSQDFIFQCTVIKCTVHVILIQVKRALQGDSMLRSPWIASQSNVLFIGPASSLQRFCSMFGGTAASSPHGTVCTKTNY